MGGSHTSPTSCRARFVMNGPLSREARRNSLNRFPLSSLKLEVSHSFSLSPGHATRPLGCPEPDGWAVSVVSSPRSDTRLPRAQLMQTLCPWQKPARSLPSKPCGRRGGRHTRLTFRPEGEPSVLCFLGLCCWKGEEKRSLQGAPPTGHPQAAMPVPDSGEPGQR